MDERRRKSRMHTEDLFLVCDALSGEIIGRVINMSVSGVMLVTEKPWPIDKISQCIIRLPEEINGLDHIEFEAISRWCKPDVDPAMFRVGYEIRKMTAEYEKVVEELLRSWSLAAADIIE